MIKFFPHGFKAIKVIKIPGKSFTDLSLEEVSLMIEADSSLSKGGNESFSSCALDEFLHCANLEGREDLKEIRNEILSNIYLDISGNKNKKINTEFLAQYAKLLRDKNNSAL